MTDVQSNAAVGRPLHVPPIEELPPLVARSALSLIDESVRFLRLNPAMLFGITAIVLLPLQLIVLALPGSSLRGNRPDRIVDVIFGSLGQLDSVASGVGTIVFESIALFVVATIYGQLAAAWYAQTAVSAEALLLAALKRSFTVLLAWGVSHILLTLAGLATLGVAAVLIGAQFMVMAPVLGAEGTTAIAALKRSWSLCSARFFSAVIFYVAVAGAGQIIDASVRFAPTLLLDQVDVPLWITNGVFDVVASIIVQSFTAATAVLYYLDARVRRDGIDLTMAIEQKFSDEKRRLRRG